MIRIKKIEIDSGYFYFEALTVMTLTYIKKSQLSLNIFCVEPFYFQGEKGLKPKRFWKISRITELLKHLYFARSFSHDFECWNFRFYFSTLPFSEEKTIGFGEKRCETLGVSHRFYEKLRKPFRWDTLYH